MNIKIKYCVAVAVTVIATAFCGCGTKSEVVKLDEVSAAPVENSEIKVEQPEQIAVDREVKVYVCGAVRTPDVYCLNPDMRIADAVDAAGGFTENAGISYINLAAMISDGQKIYIPTVSEIEEALSEGGVSTATVNITTNTPGVITENDQGNADGLVDINSADRDTLMTLPGIGQSKADKIIAYREANGGFSSIEDIMLVAGIKEGLYNKVKDKICVR